MKLNLELAVDYHYDRFPPNTLNYEKFIEPLLRATDAVARYDQMLKNMHNSEILLAPLRNQEAVISSRMEGTVSTMDEILKYEADHSDESSPSQNVRAEVIETILYQRTLKAVQSSMKDGYPLSVSLIKRMHQSLLSYGRGASKTPGLVKTEQNYIADKLKKNILFTPIKPELLQDGLDQWIQYIESSSHTPLIKIGIAHVEFEALHPFKDGNGRIGRMIITLMLWHFKIISEPHFYISGYLEENKDLYIDIMREVSQNNDWEKWCVFFLEAIEQQANRNLIVAENIRSLYEEMKTVFSDLLASKWSVNALDYMFTNPVFRNNKFSTATKISTATIGRFTKLLLEQELLVTVEEASGRKAALYAFEPLMKLVRV
jgi:Fic family protein